MRRLHLLGLLLILTNFASCRLRDPIQPAPTDDDSEAQTESPAEPATKSEDMEPVSMPAAVNEEPIAMQTQVAQRVETLSFAHSPNVCVQANPDGQANLQACDAKATGQRFLFARSLDGRVQLKDTSSQLCLAVGPIGFFVTVLRAEPCESKRSQFFSVVDYGPTYSLKFDGNNTCIDAEQSQAEPGTRLILYRCSAVLNQKIQVKI